MHKEWRWLRHNLEQLRQRHHWTQSQAAIIFDIGTRQYRRIENGESYGTVEFWLKARDIFSMSIDYLLQ